MAYRQATSIFPLLAPILFFHPSPLYALPCCVHSSPVLITSFWLAESATADQYVLSNGALPERTLPCLPARYTFRYPHLSPLRDYWLDHFMPPLYTALSLRPARPWRSGESFNPRKWKQANYHSLLLENVPTGYLRGGENTTPPFQVSVFESFVVQLSLRFVSVK